MSSETQHPSAAPIDWGEPRTREITWHDPLISARAGARLSGRALLEAMADGTLPPPPIAAVLGYRIVSVADGVAIFRAVPDESVYNPSGAVHGGWLCTLLDSAAGCAVHTLLPAGVSLSTIEIKVSFLKAIRADSGPIEVVGRVLKVGQRIGFAEAHARDGQGTLVGHATTSLAVGRES